MGGSLSEAQRALALGIPVTWVWEGAGALRARSRWGQRWQAEDPWGGSSEPALQM